MKNYDFSKSEKGRGTALHLGSTLTSAKPPKKNPFEKADDVFYLFWRL